MTRVLAIAVCSLLAGSAFAQAAPQPSPPAPPAPAQKSEAAPKKRVLRLDAFTVEGRIQKPQAFFILQRSNQGFDQAEKNESFLPKIVKSCEKDPF